MPQLLKVRDQNGRVYDFACDALLEVENTPFIPETPQSLIPQVTQQQLLELTSLATRVSLLEQDLLLLRTLIRIGPTET